jgi:hypothetical protein
MNTQKITFLSENDHHWSSLLIHGLSRLIQTDTPDPMIYQGFSWLYSTITIPIHQRFQRKFSIGVWYCSLTLVTEETPIYLWISRIVRETQGHKPTITGDAWESPKFWGWFMKLGLPHDAFFWTTEHVWTMRCVFVSCVVLLFWVCKNDDFINDMYCILFFGKTIKLSPCQCVDFKE